MRINQNIMAFNAFRNLDATNNMLAKSLEKLSSGYRINRAADDASGLVISQNLRKQVSGLQQATRNAQDGISVVQTAEGALTEIHAMLNRIRDLIVQSANTASSDSTAREAAQNEISQLRDEIDRIGQTTSFGAQKLLDGSFGAQAGRVTSVLTGNSSGLTVGSGSASFDLILDAGAAASASVHVDLTAATYATAASFQAGVQADVDTALASAAGFTGSVSVKVHDLGQGVWTVEFVRNSTDSDAGVEVANVNTGSGVDAPAFTEAAATTSNTGGGVFQVGANVTEQDQIRLSISDIRITDGTDATYTALASIDVTDTSSHAASAELIDTAINAVSTLRGELGASQNRFESTIANLQVTSENLAASESRIRDTNMALEMISFTRSQIMLQAGTAMLAQANAAPQTILRLLQG